ncbi:MAG: folate family ECF transporter S component [Clostridia bacterium]|nr:folate family ECF transporter S component [Clostridia bacterium]
MSNNTQQEIATPMNKVAKRRTPTMTITYVAALCAFTVVLELVSEAISISLPNAYKISIVYFGWFLAGAISGPIGAIAVAGISDLISALILARGSLNPLITLSSCFVAFLFAVCFHYTPIGKPYSITRSIVGSAIGCVAVAILGTMGLSTFVLWFSYSKQTYTSYFIMRLFQLVPLAINITLFYSFIPILRKLKLYWRRRVKTLICENNDE